jgi:hypothetical protein
MNGQQFLSPSDHDACDIFVKLFFILTPNQALTCLDSEHDLNVNLSGRVSHFQKLAGTNSGDKNKKCLPQVGLIIRGNVVAIP